MSAHTVNGTLARPEASDVDLRGTVVGKATVAFLQGAEPGNLSFDDWERVGHSLKAIDERIGFAIGDWVRFGEARFGERYSQAIEVTGYRIQTLRNMASVAGKFAPEKRRPDVPYSHYADVASLPEPAALTIIDRAADEGWTQRQVREAARIARPIEPPSVVDAYTFDPEPNNLWWFDRPDPRFGAERPGRLPGQVVANLIYRYTRAGDAVLDVMAGSGTTRDVCRAMDRRCFMLDLQPCRSDVLEVDVTDWPSLDALLGTIPYELAILDPPEITDDPEYLDDRDLAALDPMDYAAALIELTTALLNTHVSGVVALIVGQVARGEILTDVPVKIIAGMNRPLAERICLPSVSASGDQRKRPRPGDPMARAYREILVFR